jgi:hypothetical protein
MPPGDISYDTLAAGEVNDEIDIIAYTTDTPGSLMVNLRVASINNPGLRDSINVYVASGITGQYSFDFSCLSDTIMSDTTMVEFQFRLENTGTSPDNYAFDLRVVDSIPGWDESFYVNGAWANPGTELTERLGVWEVDTALYVRVEPVVQSGTEILNFHVQSIVNQGLRDSVNIYVTANFPGIEEYIPTTEAPVRLEIFPNPFEYSTDIILELPEVSDPISLKIYDATGRLVKQWNHPTMQPSNHISWDGRNDAGIVLPSGVYLLECSIGSNSYRKIAKLLLLR